MRLAPWGVEAIVMTRTFAIAGIALLLLSAAGRAQAGKDKPSRAFRGTSTSRTERPKSPPGVRTAFMVGGRLIVATVHAAGIKEATAIAIARGMHEHTMGIGGGARVRPGENPWTSTRPSYETFSAVDLQIDGVPYHAHLLRKSMLVGGRPPATHDEASSVFLENATREYLGPFQVSHEPTGESAGQR